MLLEKKFCVISSQSKAEANTGFSERGAGRGYGYFILGHFVVGQIMRCTDKTQADKVLVDKTPVKIDGEDKTLAILWDRKDKMTIYQNTWYIILVVK